MGSLGLLTGYLYRPAGLLLLSVHKFPAQPTALVDVAARLEVRP